VIEDWWTGSPAARCSVAKNEMSSIVSLPLELHGKFVA